MKLQISTALTQRRTDFKSKTSSIRRNPKKYYMRSTGMIAILLILLITALMVS